MCTTLQNGSVALALFEFKCALEREGYKQLPRLVFEGDGDEIRLANMFYNETQGNHVHRHGGTDFLGFVVCTPYD